MTLKLYTSSPSSLTALQRYIPLRSLVIPPAFTYLSISFKNVGNKYLSNLMSKSKHFLYRMLIFHFVTNVVNKPPDSFQFHSWLLRAISRLLKLLILYHVILALGFAFTIVQWNVGNLPIVG